MASPPVIVNHSVVRAGTSARAAAAGLAAYAGTRRGVVIEVSEADGRRLGVDGLAAYAANRTGSTGGLWGADGPVPVAEARRAIAQNGGAVLTTVVTVPNGIAPGAGLDRLDAWQALVRSEWPRLFSEMTGVPESHVEFYAAMHVNATSHHVHILTVDRAGDWDSLLPKGKMEAARLEISSKAMAPLLREAYIERDLAREAALDAVARIDRNRFDIELPPDGRIEAAHLRRFHPETSASLRAVLDRAASDTPELSRALDRHRKAVERCADLKCLTGDTRDAYIRDAAGDLDIRCENAVLRTMVPDRAPAREPLPARRTTPAIGPAAERKRKAGLATEARACIPTKRLERIARKLSQGGGIDGTDLRGCPTAERSFRQTPMAHPLIEAASAAGWGIARETTRAGNRDLADDAGERAVRAAALTMWAVAHSFDGQPETPPIEIANEIERTIAR